MKKHSLLIFPAIALLLTACAGTVTETPGLSEISVYRVVRPEYRTGSELVRAERISYTDETTAVQGAAYAISSTPDDPSLMSALPEGVGIISAALSERTVDVSVSAAYAKLEGMDKTLMDSCIALTMCSIPNVDYVAIHVQNELPQTRLSSEDIFLENTLKSDDSTQIRLYFPRAGTARLSAEYRPVTLSEDIPAARLVIDELLKGPESAGLFTVIPENTVLVSAYTQQDGICTVSFSEEFLNILNEDAGSVQLAVYSIVNSLTCLKKVESVRITIQNYQESMLGSIDISEPLTRKTQLIGAAAID